MKQGTKWAKLKGLCKDCQNYNHQDCQGKVKGGAMEGRCKCPKCGGRK